MSAVSLLWTSFEKIPCLQVRHSKPVYLGGERLRLSGRGLCRLPRPLGALAPGSLSDARPLGTPLEAVCSVGALGRPRLPTDTQRPPKATNELQYEAAKPHARRSCTARYVRLEHAAAPLSRAWIELPMRWSMPLVPARSWECAYNATGHIGSPLTRAGCITLSFPK